MALDRLTDTLNFHAQALQLRSERQRVLASNIANADTPDYQARDFDFRKALAQVAGTAAATAATPVVKTAAGHLTLTGGVGTAASTYEYRVPTQTSIDGNTVDMDAERANFADNSLKYEASLRFINGQIRTLLTAITGQ